MGYVVQRKAASFISQLYFRHGLQTLWTQDTLAPVPNRQ